MPLTADEYKALIVLEVGDTADNRIATAIDTIWTLYADFAGQGRLQYLYAKCKALDLLMGSVRTLVQVEITGDSKFSLQQRLTNLQVMRTACEAEITGEAQAWGGVDAVVVDRLTTTAPIASPDGWPDANASPYAGDPNRASPWDTRGWR